MVIKFKLFLKGKFVGYEKHEKSKDTETPPEIISIYHSDNGKGWFRINNEEAECRKPELWDDYNLPMLSIVHDKKAQYTGRNFRDKEIYIGDILLDNHDGGIGVIEWHNRDMIVIVKWRGEDGHYHTPLLSVMFGRYNKIIGNTTENPELLSEWCKKIY